MSSHLAPPVVYAQDLESLSRASSPSNSVTKDDISEKCTDIGSSRCSIVTVAEVNQQPEPVRAIEFILLLHCYPYPPALGLMSYNTGYLEWTG